MFIIVCLNELRRRIKDRSLFIIIFVAPLVLTIILGFAFGGAGPSGKITIGVTSNSQSAEVSTNTITKNVFIPPNVVLKPVADQTTLKREVSQGLIGAGIIFSGSELKQSSDLTPYLEAVLGSSEGLKSLGVDIVSSASSSEANQVAEAIVGEIESAEYKMRLLNEPYTTNTNLNAKSTAHLSGPFLLKISTLGTSRNVVGYFAPSVAIIFIFIGSGLSTRTILEEKSIGTARRLLASPVRPTQFVVGKIMAIFLGSLFSVLLLWGETKYFFSGNWGNSLGVFLMILATVFAMCSIAMFLVSLSKNEEQALTATSIVGFLLALLGGNFFPPGSLPSFLQTASLATPNGWALVGFGRLSQEGATLGMVLGPILVLTIIGFAMVSLSFVNIKKVLLFE